MRMIKILALLAMGVFLTQCYPEAAMYYDETDIVYSNYDPAYNFASKQTYAIPDKIMKIDNDLIDGDRVNYIKEPYASVLLDRINKNMKDNGWTEVDISAKPDVLLAPSAFELTTYTTYYDYWYYYDWWYGGYYPGGGWYYPYPTVDSYTTGTLMVNMVDPNETSANDRPKVVWTFFVNGLLEGSTDGFIQRYENSIDQAFEQSTYLK